MKVKEMNINLINLDRQQNFGGSAALKVSTAVAKTARVAKVAIPKSAAKPKLKLVKKAPTKSKKLEKSKKPEKPAKPQKSKKPSKYDKLNEQELALVKIIQTRQTRKVKKEAAKNKLYNMLEGFIISLAWKIPRRGMDFEDLVQEGAIGLFKAVKKFKFTRGVKLTSFASWDIRQSMQRAVADKGKGIRQPVHIQGSIYLYNKVLKAFRAAKGVDPSDTKLMRLLGIDQDKLAEIRRVINQDEVSLDKPVGDDKGDVLAGRIKNMKSPDPFEELAESERRQKVRDAVDFLKKPQEKLIVNLLFGLDGQEARTSDEVAASLGIDVSIVKKIIVNILKRLDKNSDLTAHA